MPIFVYVLLGIALLITGLLFSRAKVYIIYEDTLQVYAKYLFLKFHILPPKEKKKKKKEKKEKLKDKHKKAEPKEDEAGEKKEKSIVSKLWEVKSVLLEVIKRFFNKLHFKFFKLKASIASDNAAKTALIYGGVNQGISYIIEVLRNISNVEVANNSEISVNADFLSQKSEFETKIELYISVGSALTVGFYALKEYIKYKSTKED